MNRKTGWVLLGIALAALSGCSAGKGTTAGTSAQTVEQLSVQTTISDAPELATDGLFDAATSAGFSSHASPGVLTGREGEGDPEVNPGTAPTGEHHWWRQITGVTRSFTYEFSATDSSGRPRLVHVVVHKHFTGFLHIAWANVVTGSNGADSLVRHEIEKPLADHWVRHLWLARVPAPDSARGRGWRLVAASVAEVTSEIDDGGAQPHIESVRVQTGDQDSTFADPTAAITWNHLWCVPSGTPVTVTVTTLAPDDIVVVMNHDDRTLLTANGDNTYTGTWPAPGLDGLKHVGVNALSHGTLYGDGGYHSHAWLVPYLNRGESYRN